ncbi:hypothetical protein D3C78_1626540 [compost metagenome]
MILPLPSSPHWVPTTTTVDMYIPPPGATAPIFELTQHVILLRFGSIISLTVSIFKVKLNTNNPGYPPLIVRIINAIFVCFLFLFASNYIDL